jgi:hypothetical protein
MAIFHLFESARLLLCRLTPISAKSLNARFPPESWRQVRRITPYAGLCVFIAWHAKET